MSSAKTISQNSSLSQPVKEKPLILYMFSLGLTLVSNVGARECPLLPESNLSKLEERYTPIEKV